MKPIGNYDRFIEHHKYEIWYFHLLENEKTSQLIIFLSRKESLNLVKLKSKIETHYFKYTLVISNVDIGLITVIKGVPLGKKGF